MTNKILEPDQILDLTLSGIMEEIKSQEETEPSPKNENTLSIDNNVNALSINIVIAFCWWAVNYVIESLAKSMGNYLKENLGHYNISQQQEEHTEQRFKFNLIDMKLTEPATFEVIEIGANMTQMVEVS